LLSLSGFSIFGEIELDLFRLPVFINVGVRSIVWQKVRPIRKSNLM